MNCQRSGITALASLLMGASAHAVALYPGDVVSPCPFESLPSTTTIDNGTASYLHLDGFNSSVVEVSWAVARHNSSGQLVFTYGASAFGNAASVLTEIEVSGFEDFDVSAASMSGILVPIGTPSASSVSRSSNGDVIRFPFAGVHGGDIIHRVFIWTDALNYDLNGTCDTGNGTGHPLLTGFPRPVLDETPPVVGLETPIDFGCACDNAPIIGTAADLEGLQSYRVEWSTGSAGPWNEIATGTDPVTSDVLAIWDTNGVPHGYNFLRVIATNTTGDSASATTAVFVDQGLQSARLDTPNDNDVVGGRFCFDGTAWDACFDQYTLTYRPGAGGPDQPIDPAEPIYEVTRTNQFLGDMDSTAVPDGAYTVTLTVDDRCGNSASETASIIIDNTPPIAQITSPAPCEDVSGIVQIVGLATDANINSWSLQYAGPDGTWNVIAQGTSNQAGALASWDTTSLPPCEYAVRLLVTDKSRRDCTPHTHLSEHVVTLRVGGCASDFDDDDDSDIVDLLGFLENWFAGC